MYKRGDNIMEKGLKWLFGGLIAAVVMMFILMVSSVDAQTVRFDDGEHGYFPGSTYYMTPLTVLTPQQIDNVAKQNEIKRRWQTNNYHHQHHHSWHGGTHRQIR